ERICLSSATNLLQIYILDFGIARKITNLKGELKTPRMSVRFKGTIRFASISCHKNCEMGPKDDCESWFYLLLDIAVPKGNAYLPDKEAALGCMKCKEELGKVLDYIDSLKYHDHVDYDFIYKILTESAKIEGGDINEPYDWEVPEKPPSPNVSKSTATTQPH
ncbi:unnamed protein product, partial [Strongylus vulgaris]